MKTLPCLLAAVLAAATLQAAAPAGSGAPVVPAAPKTSTDDLFALVGRDYKKPVEVPDTFFNPFKVDAISELTIQKKAAAAVTNEMVTEAVGKRGVSGIIYATDAGSNRVIIGDQVFRVGDQLDFPDGEKGGSVPLIAAATVTLRAVDSNNLIFDFGSESESPRRASYPLRAFWRQ